MAQLKSAMDQILNKMISSQDYFSIITFSTDVNTWTESYDQQARIGIFKRKHRTKGRKYVNSLQPYGWTNINSALLEGISLAEQAKSIPGGRKLAPMVVFLTDGDATVGEVDTGKILTNVRRFWLLEQVCKCLENFDSRSRF